MAETKPKQIIVAVHGVGDQTKFATIQQVLAQFRQHHGLQSASPLGNFHTAKGTLVLHDPKEFSNYAFTEVHWADIPRKVVKDGYLLENAQSWAKTIIGRVRMQEKERGKQILDDQDYPLLEQVLKEMSETLGVLDRIFFLSAKMGLFSFDLSKLLDDYLGDVQIVADFREQSDLIVAQFSETMKSINETYPEADIYIVSHSEGTVVSLLGLLKAAYGLDAKFPDARPPWLSRVRGWMTIGSPIDKHLALWPDLFRPYKEDEGKKFKQPKFLPDQKIEWRNYYDFGDPIGFDLGMARSDCGNGGAWEKVFNFEKGHDHGFTRSLFPGKAHNDYWNDRAVFGHFIEDVLHTPPKSAPLAGDSPWQKMLKAFRAQPDTKQPIAPPGDRRWHKYGSWFLPYLVAFGLLFLAVYTVHKAVKTCLAADDLEALRGFLDQKKLDSIKGCLSPQVAERVEQFISLDRWKAASQALTPVELAAVKKCLVPGEWEQAVDALDESNWVIFRNVFGLTSLLAGLTVMLRIRRLTRESFWRWVGILVFGVGAVSYWVVTTAAEREHEGRIFSYFGVDPTVGVIVLTLLVAISANLVSRHWPGLGVKPLLFFGGASVVVVIFEHVQFSSGHGPIWPVVLAAAFFLYLWWLVALFFDLVFVWHRYIRLSLVNERLGEIYRQ